MQPHEVTNINRVYSKMREVEGVKAPDVFPTEEVKKAPWTEIETINLLKGVNQYGENEWKEILEKLHFQSDRNANDLSSKWREIKSIMI